MRVGPRKPIFRIFLEIMGLLAETNYIRFLIYLIAIHEPEIKEIDFFLTSAMLLTRYRCKEAFKNAKSFSKETKDLPIFKMPMPDIILLENHSTSMVQDKYKINK